LYWNSNYWKSFIQCKWHNHPFTSELTCWPQRQHRFERATLARLQDKLNDIKYILIDEYSMLGKTQLGWIDKCCR